MAMQVSGTAIATDSAAKRAVSFASSLENEFDSAHAGAGLDRERADAKFQSRLGRAGTATLNSSAAEAPADAVPAWLMDATPEGQTATATSEDVMEEFLQDDDMLNLEVICAKWRGLDESELEALAKICPEIAESLKIGDSHVQEFLSYRRQLNENHARKETVQRTIEKKRSGHLGNPSMDAIGEEDADGSDAENDAEPGRSSPRSPKDSLAQNQPSIDSLPLMADGSPRGMGRQSVMPGAGRRISLLQQSAVPGGRLGRVGAAVIGQDEAPGDAMSKRQSVLSNAKRGSVLSSTSKASSQPSVAPSRRG